MPKANTFTALGRGNGFGFCPKKVDVSEFDNWITLGGVSSGSASKAEIIKSLVNAMKVFWNLHSAQASFTAKWNNDTLAFDKDLPNHEYVTESKPIERLCKAIKQPPISSTDMTEAELNETDGFGCRTGGGFLILRPVRMYNGDTTNRLNFVGYGFSNLFGGSAGGSHNEGSASAGAEVRVASYLDGNTEVGSSEEPPDSGNVFYFNKKASKLILDNIPFRSFCSAVASTTAESAFSESLTTTSSSASASGTFASSQSVSGGVELDNLDFYTY